jgi:ribose/xylose/arabinose/galactoside ABC-type transport system permease subunit
MATENAINENPVRLKDKIFRREFTMLFVLIGMIIVSAVISPVFRSPGNIMNILNQNAIYGLIAIGMSFVLVSGDFDLSVGSTAALTGIVSALFFRNYGPVAGFAGGLAVGIFVGLANGLIIMKLKINAFVATLGTQTIARGATYIITSAHPVSGIPKPLNIIGIGKIGPIPIAALFWLVIAVVMYCIMKFTVFGQYVYSVGGNKKASWLSGVNVSRIKIIAFLLSGLFASFAGFIIIFRLMIATSDAAMGYELTAIASCVVGGVSLEGGRGSVLGSVIGTLIFGLILNMLQLLGISSFWQSAITGFVILVVVGIDSFSKSGQE